MSGPTPDNGAVRGAILRAQRFPALGATRVDNLATRFGCHARTKAVTAFADEIRGLKGAFHRAVSNIAKRLADSRDVEFRPVL